MKNILLVLFLVSLFQFASSNESITIGEKVSIYSDVLKEDRELLIYLPTDYSESELNYPVLFQVESRGILFHKETGEIRYLSEFSDIIPQMIVVSIVFTDYRRDIFPVAVPRIPGSGGSDNFLKFIETELVPFLNENYRTSDYRILYGQSNTGMFTLYTMLSKPELFDSYIAASPAVGQGDNFMFGIAEEKLKPMESLSKTLFITYALDDPLTSIVGKALPGFLEIIKTSVPADLNWKYEEYETGGHCPPITLQNGLKFIFSDWNVEDEIIQKGPKSVEKKCDELNDKYGICPDKAGIFRSSALDNMQAENYDLAFEYFLELRKLKPEDFLYAYQIGKIAAVTGKYIQEGIAALQDYIDQENNNPNPSKSAAYWRMGLIYEKTGDKFKAEESYRKGLELDPKDPYCKKALEEL
jgi:enterochelin esterase-like enzyme